jgi:protein TonB
MKLLYLFILLNLFVIASSSYASTLPKNDTTNKTGESPIFTAIDVAAEYPGGLEAFDRFISRNLKYPELAKLIGINGKVYLTFVVEKDGKISNVNPVSCLGAGCESEAVRVISMSRDWKPGLMDGRPVRVMYTLPIAFRSFNGIVYLKHLRKSDFGFVFDIKGKFYTADEAKKIIGDSYSPMQIETVEPFYNANKDPKFNFPGKKEIYLLKIDPDENIESLRTMVRYHSIR